MNDQQQAAKCLEQLTELLKSNNKYLKEIKEVLTNMDDDGFNPYCLQCKKKRPKPKGFFHQEYVKYCDDCLR